MATSGILVTQFDYSKLFIFRNIFRTASYTNSTGSAVTLTKGMLMGRIYSSAKVKQSVSTATDGSQLPIGVLSKTQTVADGVTVTVTICIQGEVAREGIIFATPSGGSVSDGYTTKLYTVGGLDSPADSDDICVGILEDWLWARGILTTVTTENTKADNA